MTQEFESLIRLVAAGALGRSAVGIPQDIDWNRLETLAKDHHVEILVGYALRLSPEIGCPADFRHRMIMNMRQVSLSNNAWRTLTLQLIQNMKLAGIPVILLKGYAVASCYAAPDCRVSGDTDLLIPPEYEKQAYIFMEKNGFHVIPRWNHGHHGVCKHPIIGCVEIHVQLYDELVEDVWFQKRKRKEFLYETPIQEQIDNIEYTTLAATDHLLFMTLHLVKHFIMTGISLQMIVDIVLFYKKYVSQIDEERFWSELNALKFTPFISSVLWTIIQYFDLDPFFIQDLKKPNPEQVALIFDDFENGGWLGYNNKHAREEGWYEYNRQVIIKEKGSLGYFAYMFIWKLGRYIYVLFPTKKQLELRYPSIQNKVYLIPYAWIKYISYRLRRAASRGSFTSEIVTNKNGISSTGAERVEMFRKLGML